MSHFRRVRFSADPIIATDKSHEKHGDTENTGDSEELCAFCAFVAAFFGKLIHANRRQNHHRLILFVHCADED